jgi:hypothetical protein
MAGGAPSAAMMSLGASVGATSSCRGEQAHETPAAARALPPEAPRPYLAPVLLPWSEQGGCSSERRYIAASTSWCSR